MAKNVENGWVQVDGLRIHCLKAGEGNEPVLLLHVGGYDSASLSYEHSVGPISEHQQVFAPDWPGYGESDKPEMEYSTEYCVDFLGHLMDALGLEKTASTVSITRSLTCRRNAKAVVGFWPCCEEHGLSVTLSGADREQRSPFFDRIPKALLTFLNPLLSCVG